MGGSLSPNDYIFLVFSVQMVITSVLSYSMSYLVGFTAQQLKSLRQRTDCLIQRSNVRALKQTLITFLNRTREKPVKVKIAVD